MTEMKMINVKADYKYTFPVSKSFTGEDGRARLIGFATGPEVDLEGHRVDPALITRWASAINRGEMQLVYRDQHRRDTAIEDLGVIEKAWVDTEGEHAGHLGVQILLDEDNPVAQYIHKAAAKGKQYGMSIHGKATRVKDEIIANGRMVRTILDGTLDEISHTTRPVWTPSFGTVLSKSVDEALSAAAEGDNSVTEKVEETHSEVDPAAAAAANKGAPVTTESGAAVAPETGKAPAVATSTPAAPVSGVVEVEKSVSAEKKADPQELATQFAALFATFKESGLLNEKGELVVAKTEEKTIEKAVASSTESTDVAELKKSVSALTDIVTTLADSIKDGSAPGLIQKSVPVDPIAELAGIPDPLERLRTGLAALHGSDVQR